MVALGQPSTLAADARAGLDAAVAGLRDRAGTWVATPVAERIGLLEELTRPAADASTRYPFVTLEWARRWPSEEIWKARKRG